MHFYTYPWWIYYTIISWANIVPGCYTGPPGFAATEATEAVLRRHSALSHTAQVRLQAVLTVNVHPLAHLDLPYLVAPSSTLLGPLYLSAISLAAPPLAT